jgi:hypothetical protein
MLGYSGIELALSSSIRFISNEDMDGTEPEIFARVKALSLHVAYLDTTLAGKSTNDFVNSLASAITLSNAPYSCREWLAFSDDLTTLSYLANGLVIIVENSRNFIVSDSKNFFSLIESFLVQVHHWQEKQKPCYLCFQMDSQIDPVRWI